MSKYEINAIDMEVHFQVSEPNWLLFLHLDLAIRQHMEVSKEDYVVEIHPGPKDESGNCTSVTMRICPRERIDKFISKQQRNRLFDLIFGSFSCTKVDGLAHTYQRERNHGEDPLKPSYEYMSLEEYHWTNDDYIVGQPFMMRVWRLPDCILDKLDSRWENSYMTSECSYMVLVCGQMAHLAAQDVEVLPYIPVWRSEAKEQKRKEEADKQQNEKTRRETIWAAYCDVQTALSSFSQASQKFCKLLEATIKETDNEQK